MMNRIGLLGWVLAWALTLNLRATEPVFRPPVADVWVAGANGHGTLVLVGATGRILVSSNGVNWVAHRLLTNRLNCVTYGGDRFMAITSDGIPQTSPTGKDWTAHNRLPLTPNASVTGVAYSTTAGVFVAVDTSGAIWTSPNGSTWSEVYRTTLGESFMGIASNGGYLAAISQYTKDSGNDYGRVLVASSPSNWKEERDVLNEFPTAIFWVQNQFMVVGEQGTSGDSLLLTSNPIGTIWSDRNVAGVSEELVSAFYADGQYYLIDWAGVLYTSVDGIKGWKALSDPLELLSFAVGGVANAKGRPVLFGFNSIVFQPATSTAWMEITDLLVPDFIEIACGNSACVGMTDSDLWVRNDTGEWIPVSIPLGKLEVFGSSGTLTWTSVTFGQGRYLLTGNVEYGNKQKYGFLLSSQNGFHWSIDRAAPEQTYSRYIFAQSKYLAVGTKFINGTKAPLCLWSTAQSTWTEGLFSNPPTPLKADLVGIFDGVAGLVAFGESGTLYHSADGVTWQDVSLVDGDSIAFGVRTDLGYSLIDEFGYLWDSTNGKVWTGLDTMIPSGITRVIHAGGKFIAVGLRGNIWMSSNGNTWTNIKTPTIEHLYGIAQTGPGLIAVGEHGTVLQSKDGLVWTLVHGNRIPQSVTATYAVDASSVTFEIRGQINSRFAVAQSPELGSSPSWISGPEINLTNSPMQIRLPFGANRSGFYRVETLPSRP